MILENPNLDVDLEKHIHRSLQRLRDAPVTLTGWGLVSMNRSFILSVLGVLATYLVVVVQMSSNTGHSPQMECSCDIYGHESYSPSAF
ncbi:hypothetical protein BV898_17587 [Hypsibius exemplaris]|uniref:Gustatory receptor n=1 Tax=Hypsibius exemplaris TaxID=2072580 RepID=A0A9X6NI83_HYPEX|nr:hypothetical protein BV898_17587 [Hypsibius exemplaris]